MKRKLLSVLLTLVLVLSFSLVAAVPVGADAGKTLYVEGRTPPVINGTLILGEWDDYFWFEDTDTPLFQAYVTGDDDYLYIAISSSGLAYGDMLFVNIDANHNHEFDGDGTDFYLGALVGKAPYYYRSGVGRWDRRDADMIAQGFLIQQTDSQAEFQIPRDQLLSDTVGFQLAVWDRDMPSPPQPTDRGNRYPGEGDSMDMAHPNYGDLALPPFSSIQAAISAADPGDTINVAAGIYDEDVTIDKSLRLISVEGKETTTINGQGTGATVGAVQFAEGVSDVIIGDTGQGFTINGAGQAAVLMIHPTSGVTIRDNILVSANGSSALETTVGQHDHLIQDNTFKGDAKCLVYVNGFYGPPSTNVDFIGNTFSGTALLALGQEATDSEISGNTFATVSDKSLELWGADNTITGNYFSADLPSGGLYVSDGTGTYDIAEILSDNTFLRAVTIEHPGASLLPKIWANIQDGIDAAETGDTVNVAAGIYPESYDPLNAIYVSKSLTIKGAGKADTVVDAGRVSYGVSIRTKPTGGVLDYVAIKDLTVKNAGHSNIRIADTALITEVVVENVDLSGEPGDADFRNGLGVLSNTTVENLLVKNCTFENIKRYGVRVDSGSTVGHLTVIDSVFDTNEEAKFYDGVFNQAGIESCGNIGDLTVSGSTFTNTFNGVRLFWYWTDRIPPVIYSIDNVDIEGSTFEGNDASFFFCVSRYREGSPPPDEGWAIGDIQIHGCSFLGNEWGVKFDDSGMEEVYKDVVIDATNNWWGHSSGPADAAKNSATGYEAYGDAVSTNVDYNPWLLELGGKTYDKTLALNIGWTLISIDKKVTTGTTWAWVEPTLVYKYTYQIDDGVLTSGFEDATLADLEPLSAIYVKTVGGGGVGFNYTTEGEAPVVYTKDLGAGWNLISSPSNIKADGLLAQLRYVTGEMQQWVGLTTLVSLGDYNQFTSDFYLPTLTETHWNDLKTKTLIPFDGYWAYMEAADTFSVPVR